jgi:NAD-dependent deacetylase
MNTEQHILEKHIQLSQEVLLLVNEHHSVITALAEQVHKAKTIAVLTGAGVSAESGVSTFRDPDGFWSQFRPQDLASMNGFLSNPPLVWQWYQARRDVLERVQPNAGHYALALLQHLCLQTGKTFSLATQNVDRLHHRAGSTNVVELHGNIVDNHCSRCSKPYQYVYADNPHVQEPPRCPYCGGMIRPSVVWFGEHLPFEEFARAERDAEMSDMYFTIGTSAEVYPAAGLPLEAKRSGAFVVEINPHPTSISSRVDCSLHLPSGIALPAIVRQFQQIQQAQQG